MIIGIPKEIKPFEYRVAVTPEGVAEIIQNGHKVLIEKNAGIGSGFSDANYLSAGAEIKTQSEIYNDSNIIYKVKELFPKEFSYLRDDLIVFTYLHSNAHPEMTDAFLNSGATGIAYEDIEDESGQFPLLKPMSEIAGKGGYIAALQFMQSCHGGKGLLLSNVVGLSKPEIVIIGAGVAGLGATELAVGFGNHVTILDIDIVKLETVKNLFDGKIECLMNNKINLEKSLGKADVLINCILWPKSRTDHLIDRQMLSLMKPGSLIVDVACDEGGAIETCKATTHQDPVYEVDGIIHYCVDNIPSTFARTSTYYLSQSTLPYLLKLAKNGVEEALKSDNGFRKGLSFYKGKLTLEETALKQNREYVDSSNLF